MAYRDENEALRARITQLEAENAGLRERLALVETAPRPHGDETARRWLGGPVRIEVVRTFAGALPKDAHERIVEILQESFGTTGTASVLGNTLRWGLGAYNAQRQLEVTVSSRRGETRLHILERLGSQAGGLFGGIGGGVGGGGMGLVIPLAMFVNPVLALALAPLWLLAVYGAVRAGYGALTRRREAEIHRAAEAVTKAIEDELVPAAPRVRIEEPASVDDDAEDHARHPARARGDASR